MLNWYVVHVKPHKDRQVGLHLGQNQIESFVPLIRVNPVNPRSARVRSLFPGYVFVRVDLQATGLSALQWTPGVQRLLDYEGQPAVVAVGAMAALKRRVAEISAGGGLALDGVKAGDRVRVVGGPFAGYEAVFDTRLPGAERVRIFLDWARHKGPRTSFLVELDAGHIQKLKPRR